MTHEEIEDYRRELQNILQKHESKVADKEQTGKTLRELAVKVGASGEAVFLNIGYAGFREVRPAEIPELAYNIHFALQTASMIDARRTAAKNHEVALRAQESARVSQWVSVGAMLAAIASAVAVWIWH
jgi:hypothetical protein